MTDEMVHQSNGYVPVLVVQGDEGGMIKIQQKDMQGFALHPAHAEMLGRVFEHMVGKFQDKPEQNTLTSNLHYTDDNGNALIAVLVVKGQANGNAGDWFLAPKDQGWKDRLLEGSRHLEEMADALNFFRGSFLKRRE